MKRRGEKEKKRKIEEKEAIGRAVARKYKSKFFNLESEKYQDLDLKLDGLLRKRFEDENRRRIPKGRRKMVAVK